ncbi:MAG: AbrB/MazE/SpoVT family DNA-binding domain-containing protein [Xanthobacteraceae bacterium]|nr:AbrB/MazE/SpoVT family DNA-binding domain-containing protein [Xanthobacteraceae bacterium]
MKSQVRKVGNSHGVIIPKPLLDEIGIVDGDVVNLKVNKKGRIVLSPVRTEARAGWAADSKALAQAGETGRVWPQR